LIVVDASVVGEILLASPDGRRLGAELVGREEPLHAPHLLDIETTNLIRKAWLRRDLGEARGFQALADLADLSIERHGHLQLLVRVWELREVLTAYDATYVALAEMLDAVLVTRDGRLARSRGHRAQIELL
jgi:predicted nucleic acid-binding protein